MLKKITLLALCIIYLSTPILAKNPIVRMETNHGDIIIELYPEKAPISCKNFLQYVEDNYYDGTIFHRVIKGFMIQGGGYNPGIIEKAVRESIMNEAGNGLNNEEGTIAMARTSEINSATSQFFINTANNDFLNHKGTTKNTYGYAVFGKVIQGMETVRKIESVKITEIGYFSNCPAHDVLIRKVTVLRNTPAKK